MLATRIGYSGYSITPFWSEAHSFPEGPFNFFVLAGQQCFLAGLISILFVLVLLQPQADIFFVIIKTIIIDFY